MTNDPAGESAAHDGVRRSASLRPRRRLPHGRPHRPLDIDTSAQDSRVSDPASVRSRTSGDLRWRDRSDGRRAPSSQTLPASGNPQPPIRDEWPCSARDRAATINSMGDAGARHVSRTAGAARYPACPYGSDSMQGCARYAAVSRHSSRPGSDVCQYLLRTPITEYHWRRQCVLEA